MIEKFHQLASVLLRFFLGTHERELVGINVFVRDKYSISFSPVYHQCTLDSRWVMKCAREFNPSLLELNGSLILCEVCGHLLLPFLRAS